MVKKSHLTMMNIRISVARSQVKLHPVQEDQDFQDSRAEKMIDLSMKA